MGNPYCALHGLTRGYTMKNFLKGSNIEVEDVEGGL